MSIRNEIPQRAYINAEILQALAQSTALDAATKGVSSKYGLGQYLIFGPSHVVSLLYCLLVVPKEIWLQPADDLVWARIRKLDPAQHFDVVESDDTYAKDPPRQLIRRLRNSIAHARYDIQPDLSFKFCNRANRDAADTFVAISSAEQLSRFLSDVGSFLANLRNRASPDKR